MQRGGFVRSQRYGRTVVLRMCIALLAMAASATSVAQDQWGGSLAITSDYVYRGVSYSRGRVAYQGGAHVRLPSGWQMGVWASTLEARDGSGTPIEATAFVAHGWTLGADWSARVGYTHYQYFGPPTLFSYDYDEVFASVTYQSQLTVGVTYSPNVVRYRHQQTVLRDTAAAIDVNWLQPLAGTWSATVGAGYYDVSALYATGYAYWHLGVMGVLGPIELDLLHINSDSHAAAIYGESLTGPRWAAIARWRF
jgi:uncharacterized protein (TIGR02001 family)